MHECACADIAQALCCKVNVDKCEVVVFARSHQAAAPVCEVEGSTLPVGPGYKKASWSAVERNLMAMKSIEENIRKAREGFFSYWGVWDLSQGDLGPLSNRSQSLT